jgi:two-component system sensor histidine kinase KdpD
MPPPASPIIASHYVATAAIVAACALLGWLSHLWHLEEANIVMIFLLGVAVVAARYGKGPAIAASVVSVLLFDFCFVPPYLTFAVSDVQYLLTFGIMLVIALLISALALRMRGQVRAAQQQERRTAALYRLNKQLSEIAGTEFVAAAAVKHLAEIFTGEAAVYLRDKGGLRLRQGEGTSIAQHPVNALVAQWVAEHDQPAGAGTDTLPNATAFFVPLAGSQHALGAIGIRPDDAQRFQDPEQRRLLETCASLIALAIERDESLLAAHEAQVQVQAEQLRSSLLSSVSHDLRTPLAAIAGASSILLDETPAHDARSRELLQTVVDESRRLARLVDNLLDMTRLESGAVAVHKQWHVLEEIVGSALNRLRTELAQHVVAVDLPGDLPLLSLDGVLFEQVLVNLLENAARYTPPGSRIEISAYHSPDRVELRVADTGPGLPPGTETRVFEKFFRGNASPDSRRGVGLGLAICQAIVQAHGGRIRARNRPQGGAEFTVVLPRSEPAPQVTLDEPGCGQLALRVDD